MRQIFFLIILSAILVFGGCQPGQSRIYDNRYYATGELQSEGWTYHHYNTAVWPFAPRVENLYGHSSEYYKNGRLKSLQWNETRSPLLRLEFYENGQLRLEERYLRGTVDYGAYYAADGRLEKTVGQRHYQTTK